MGVFRSGQVPFCGDSKEQDQIMNTKQMGLVAVIVMVSGCGSFTTVLGSEQGVRAGLSRVQSDCTSIPRLYSGVIYNFCMVNGKPSDFAGPLLLSYFLYDSAFSLVLDTVFLPYTVYTQIQHGPIPFHGLGF
jgi:uncharacterized protein YceK